MKNSCWSWIYWTLTKWKMLSSQKIDHKNTCELKRASLWKDIFWVWAKIPWTAWTPLFFIIQLLLDSIKSNCDYYYEWCAYIIIGMQITNLHHNLSCLLIQIYHFMFELIAQIQYCSGIQCVCMIDCFGFAFRTFSPDKFTPWKIFSWD